MSRFAPGGVARQVGLVFLGTGVAVLGHAAPPGQAETFHPPVHAAASPSPDPLLELTGKPAAATGRIATLPASTVPLEEEPRVDRREALMAVLRSTAAAVPWLHLGPVLGVRQREGHAGPDAAGALPHESRFDDARSFRAAGPHAAEPGGGTGHGESVPQLSREIAQFARELLDNPLAWMVGLLTLMVAVTVSVVRKGGK